MATNQWGPIYSESDGVVNSPDNRFDVENLPSPPAFNAADGESSTESFVSGSVQTTQHGSPAIKHSTRDRGLHFSAMERMEHWCGWFYRQQVFVNRKG